MKTRNDQLILKKLLGIISREEDIELAAWLNGNPEAKKKFEQHRQQWHQKQKGAPEFSLSGPTFSNPAPHHEQPPQVRQQKIVTRSAMRKRFRIAEGIAIALLCVSSFLLFLGLKDYPELHKAENSIQTFMLKDSSAVTLKPKSAIKVSGHYLDKNRTIYLYGDGYFQVHNVPKPFIVKTGNTSVQGTRNDFIVNTVNDGQTEVMVMKGEMKVTPLENPYRVVSLASGQRAVIDKKGTTVAVTTFDTLNALAWKEKILVFNQTSMDDAIPTLEDYFNIDIELKNPAIGACKISRTFREPNVVDVTEALRRMLGVTALREPGKIVLDGKGCKTGKAR